MKRETAGWMVGLGLLALVAGAAGVGRWAAISGAARVYYSLSLAMGAAAATAGVWVLARWRAGRWLVWGALAALAILAVNQGAGLWLNSIACYTSG